MSERILGGLAPERVFYYFEEIAAIPHPSYHEEAIGNYLVAFAKKHNLAGKRDKAGNVIIIREASEGRENEDAIILQGHMDMVAEKESDCTKDMEKEGLDLEIDGDFVKAKGTTLGGDDGIAIAYALALLEDDTLSCPKLEFVCTVSEETGMEGAHAIDLSDLSGRKLINIDSEEEGYLLASCAGGGRLDVALPLRYKEQDGTYFTIHVFGLAGGHSGSEIDKGRANANQVLARVLRSAAQKINVRLASFNGGNKDNAIPREASAVICVPTECRGVIATIVDREAAKIRREYAQVDGKINIQIERATSDPVLSTGLTNQVIRLILSLPNGVIRMSDRIEGLVETSLNLGIVTTNKEELRATYALRSSVASAYEALRENMIFFAEGFGAEVTVRSEYPAWEYRDQSPLRDTLCGVYEELFGKPLVVQAIHAGLECGILASKIPGLDAVSIGPDLYDVHTPAEKMSISSVERTYRFLRAVIEKGC